MAERAVAIAKKPEAKKTCSNFCRQNIGFKSSGPTVDMILQLQKTAGNRAVQKLIKSGALQAKLRVGQPNDVYEQEADRVAEQLIKMPDPGIGRQVTPFIPEIRKDSGEKIENQKTIMFFSMAQPNYQSCPSCFSNLDLIQRQSAASEKKTQQPTPMNTLFTLEGRSDSQNLTDIMTVVQSVGPLDVEKGLYITQFKGKTITLTLAERNQLNVAAKRAITKSLEQAKRDAAYAKSGYESQKKINDEQWFVSAIVTTFAGVRSKGIQLETNILKADVSAAAAENALKANNFVEAGRRLVECEMAAKQAKIFWREYHEGIIGTGDKTVKVLEYTRDASFFTLGVLAIIATGGAAAAGTGAATTTTAFGLEVGTVSTANLIATGAPIVATLGSAGMQVAIGDKVDWAKVGIDVAVNIFLSKFGGEISNTVFKRMLGNPSVRSIGAIAFGRIFSSLITHELSTAFITSIDATYRKLKGQNVTWIQFADELVEKLLDPKGLAAAGIMGAVVARTDAKLADTPVKGKIVPKEVIDGKEGVKTKETLEDVLSSTSLETAPPKAAAKGSSSKKEVVPSKTPTKADSSQISKPKEEISTSKSEPESIASNKPQEASKMDPETQLTPKGLKPPTSEAASTAPKTLKGQEKELLKRRSELVREKDQQWSNAKSEGDKADIVANEAVRQRHEERYQDYRNKAEALEKQIERLNDELARIQGQLRGKGAGTKRVQPKRGQERPHLPRGKKAAREHVNGFKEPFKDPKALKEQQEILNLAKKDPNEAGRRYEDLVASDIKGGKNVQNKFRRPGRRMDIGTEHEVTIEGMNNEFGKNKLDQLWDDLVDKGNVTLTVPKLSPQARDQLSRLLAQVRAKIRPNAIIVVRETLP